MKKLFLLLVVIALFVGCAFLQERKLDVQACLNDPICLAQAKGWQTTGETVGTVAGSVVPGAAAPVQKAVGYAALGIALLLGGHALRKKQ